jgi:hypothetical protein
MEQEQTVYCSLEGRDVFAVSGLSSTLLVGRL